MSSADAGTLKRKHSVSTQQKLSFTAQQKPNSTATAPLSPTTKRTRRESSPREAATPVATSTMSTADMYSFPSKRASIANGKEIVDISSSPDASPAKPRNGIMRKTAPNMAVNAGPKRLMVKNFKPTRKVDPKAFLDQTWQKIEGALDTIFRQGDIDFSLEELYRGVENLCRQNMARDVKERLVKKCKEYVGGALKTKVKDSLGRTNVDVLRATLQAWSTWHEQVQYLDWIFCYLDRSYLLLDTSPSATSLSAFSAPSSSSTPSSTRVLSMAPVIWLLRTERAAIWTGICSRRPWTCCMRCMFTQNTLSHGCSSSVRNTS